VRAAQSTGVYWGVEEHLDIMFMYVRCMGDSISLMITLGKWRKEGGLSVQGVIPGIMLGPRTT